MKCNLLYMIHKIEPISCRKTKCVNISSGSSKESGYLGSEPGFNVESESYFRPATQNVYARRQSKKEQKGIFSLRCDANQMGSDFHEAANVSQVFRLYCYNVMCLLKL